MSDSAAASSSPDDHKRGVGYHSEGLGVASAAPAPAKGDGEMWEDYAHRLEARIKQQRGHIKNLTELRKVPGDMKARNRIASLERLLGKKELALAQQHGGLHALKTRVVELESRKQPAAKAEHKPALGITVMRIRRLRRSRWFWFRLNVGFGKRGLYVERY